MNEALLRKLKEADQALTTGSWEQARSLFREVYRSAPDDPNIHAGMAFAAYKTGRMNDANRHFADACLRRREPQWAAFLADAFARDGAHLAAYRLYHWIEREHPAQYAMLVENALLERISAGLRDVATRAGLASFALHQSPDRSPMALKATQGLARLLHQKKALEAIAEGEAMRRKFPRATGVLVNLGLAYKRTGKFAEAGRLYLEAFLISPPENGVCTNLGNLLIEMGEMQMAVRFLEASAIAAPDDSMVWSNLAAAYNHTGALPIESEFAARKALELNCPAKANTHRSLAASLSRQGRVAEAIVEYERGYDPNDEVSRTAPLMAMIMADGFDADQVAQAHRKYGSSLEAKIIAPAQPRRGTLSGEPVIGFVTADFRDHSVAYFALGLLEHLAARGVKVCTYSNFAREDGISAQMRGYCAQWRTIRGADDDAVVRWIGHDQVDALIDLSGHTAGHRLPVFMRRPAPLQMTWLGHPATTGLKTIDARITDAVADPPGVDHRYTETLIRMQGTFCAYRPLIRRPEMVQSAEYGVQPPPALKNGYITFGSCNTLAKYSDTTIRVWAKVLHAVPGSRLMIESPGLHTVALQRLLVQRFGAAGVEPQRLDLRERDRSRQYLIYNDMDISLDSFPCNGGTTTFDLLWMGVPLVTLAGEAFAGRMGASLLSGLGRAEWVARTEDEFVAIASTLASNVNRLARWRQDQRAQMQSSVLMDEPGFAERFLSAIHEAWSLHT